MVPPVTEAWRKRRSNIAKHAAKQLLLCSQYWCLMHQGPRATHPLYTYIFVCDTVHGLCMRLSDMGALHGCKQSRRKGLPAAVKLLSHTLTRVRAQK